MPAGRWTSHLSGALVEGPRWVQEEHGFLSLPLLVRPNTVLAVGAVDDRPDYEFGAGITFEVYALDDGSSVTAVVPTMAGGVVGSVTVTRSGNRYEATTTDEFSNWKLLLVGIGEGRGTEVLPNGDVATVTV